MADFITSDINILNSTEYFAYRQEWRVRAQNDADVKEAFTLTGAGRITCVSFPLDMVKMLASTVRANQIKVRFLIDPALGASKNIIVALYVTDENDMQLSPYYISNTYWTTKTYLDPPQNPAFDSGMIPAQLAKDWLIQWSLAPTIKPVMFVVPGYFAGNPLYGYNFDLQDFIDLLNTTASIAPGGGLLGVDFGLHNYYSAPVDVADGPPPLTTLCGVVLRVYDANGPILTPIPNVKNIAAASYFYDLSMPCPPGT